MRNILIVIAALLLGIVVLSAIHLGLRKRNQALVDTIQTSMTNQVVTILIEPDQLSPEDWTVELNDKADLTAFVTATVKADSGQVSGHSGPIGEWTITLVFATGQKYRYAASVHKYEPQYLFLTDEFYVKTSKGHYTRGNPRRARIPDLGPWIMKRAPKGIL